MLLSSLISNSTIQLDSTNSSDLSDSPANPQSNPPGKTPKLRKRKLEAVIADITSLKKLEFTPLSVIKQAPQLNLSSDLDMTSSYFLFSLFFTEGIFEKIANSTNAYAHLKRHADEDEEEEKHFQG